MRAHHTAQVGDTGRIVGAASGVTLDVSDCQVGRVRCVRWTRVAGEGCERGLEEPYEGAQAADATSSGR